MQRMRFSFLPYVLNYEDARRLCATLLRRYDGTLALRELNRRHRFPAHVTDAAAAAGIIRIEKRQPYTGRPSRVAVLEPDAVNKCVTAKLPHRCERPLPLNFREESFLCEYIRRWGTKHLGGGRGSGSAAHAYRKAYGKHRAITAASARSAGARLARRPWMKAAFYLDRKGMLYGQRQLPADLRSSAREWLELVRAVNASFADWPADVRAVLRSVKTYPEAIKALAQLPRFNSGMTQRD